MKPAAAIFVSFAIFAASCGKPKDHSMNVPKPKPEELTIETPEGTVVGHTTEVDDFPQKVVPVNAAEARQFEEWARGATGFLTAYGTPQSENDLKQYDEAFKGWQDSQAKRHSDQDVINILGAYLGQRMVQDFDMEWVMVTDQYGKDYAVRHKTSELLTFPFSSVMKRIEDNEHDFIHGVYHVLKHEVEQGELKQRTNSEQDGGGQPVTRSESK